MASLGTAKARSITLGVLQRWLLGEVTAGAYLKMSVEKVAFLKEKFGGNTNPSYFLKEVTIRELEMSRAELKLKAFRTIDGTAGFQVIVFKPDSMMIKAAPHLCICNECLNDYGLCALFNEYEICIQQLNKTFTR